jgi:thioredoxin-like negative regulator of GroEL
MEAVSQATFAQQVIEASRHRPVLVDFWGPRCAPCLKLMPWVEKLADELADSARIVKLNTAENRRFAADLGVMGLPTFALYADGQEVERLTGDECTPKGILGLLQSHVRATALSAGAD